MTSLLARHADLLMVAGVILILVMMVMPLPSAVLDILLALNISMSLAILIITMYITQPLQFAAFPSILLISTLFRLALNVSSTRLILLHGYAGRIIEAFGQFVVGGNYVVGLVVFIILVVIQFVVITNGAGRVAEVAARFTLDAMPGKQMSIDADMNAGLITEAEARQRRREIEREADFYGAMDGASKFVRGDAVAGIVIIIVNIVGGIVVGMLQQGRSLTDAMSTFTLLTVGDGLVSQIPALLISTATGIIVTRSAGESNLGRDVASQVLAHPRVFGILAAALLVFGLMPGLPTLPFLVMAGGSASLAYALRRGATAPREVPPPAEENRDAALDVTGALGVEDMEMEIGYGLIPMVDEQAGGDLFPRLTMVRRQVAGELGIVVPPIRVRDNLQLPANTYVIKIRGLEVARGEVMPGRLLAMNPGTVREEVTGIPTREPAFGLSALWIASEDKDRAEIAGYTVVDPTSTIATHLSEVIKAHARELVGRQEVQNLIDRVKEKYPAVVKELVPDLLTLGEIQKVIGNLLEEQVSVRDLVTILEALADAARITKDPVTLTEYARQALARHISRKHVSPDGVIHAITVDPALEQVVASAVQEGPQGSYLALEPSVARELVARAADEMERAISQGLSPVILCSTAVRPHIRALVARAIPGVAVLSYSEIVPEVNVTAVGMVSVRNADQAV